MAKRGKLNHNCHRGRFQAQGKGLEESEAWSQISPLPYLDGEELISKIENKIKPSFKKERQKYFDIWRIKIKDLYKMGGYDADSGGHYIKSVPPGASPNHPRVDLEIRKGKAFI